MCRLVVLTSDGEWGEGSNWEAALFAAHHGLDNLICILDYNKLQSLKGDGQSSRLCYLGHALMENRHALIVDTSVTLASSHPLLL